MLRASRDEALTDALTGLGNRRALAARARPGARRTADAEQPARARALRPRRLQALQRHLRPPGRRRAARPPRRAAWPRSSTAAATAYRMGGDEFCALLEPGDEARRPARRRRRRGAVRARRGLRGSAARYGSIAAARARRRTPPRRCASPTSACTRTRTRGRTSAERQSKDVLLRALAERNPELATTSTTSPTLAEAIARRARPRPTTRSSRSATPPSCTTSARSPSRTRSSPSPARSTSDEWAFIRRHTLIGERIIAAAPALARVAAARALQPRALGRPRLPRRPRGRRHPARRPHRRRRRRLRRDDRRPALRAPRAPPRRRWPSCAAAPARSSTRPSSRRSATPGAAAPSARPAPDASLEPPSAGPRRAVGADRSARVRPAMAAARTRPADARRCTTATWPPGARLVPFAGWEMPVQYAGIRDEHLAVRERAGVFDVSPHGRDRDLRPAGAERSCSTCSPTTSPDRRGRRAVLRRSAARTAACSTTSSPTGSAERPLPDRHERRQPREGPRLVPAAGRGLRRRRARPRSTTSRCSPSRARGARGIVERLADGELPARFHDCSRTVAGVPARSWRHGLHGRGRRRAARRAPTAPRGVGRAARGRASSPSASARATRCAWRSATTSTATTWRDAQPDRGGAGLVPARRTTGFVGAEAVARRARGRARPRSSSRSS